MTIDEAIKHAEEVADKKKREKQKWDKWLESDSDHRAVAEKVSCEMCAEEHRQLAEWLKELKAHREAWNKLKNDVVAYHNNYDYDTAMHFLKIIDNRMSEIGRKVMQNDKLGEMD